MACINNICVWLLCFISLKDTETAKIYVIDVPLIEEVNSIRDYTDSDSYDGNRFKHILGKSEDDRASIVFCTRLFGSMSTNGNKKHIQCLEALKNKVGKLQDYAKKQYFTDKIRPNNNHEQVGRQQQFLDLKKFSQDYLDVNDLTRNDFADEYVDINDFRIAHPTPERKGEIDEFGKINSNCAPPSRKALDAVDDGLSTVSSNSDSSNSDESAIELDNAKNILRKGKRYKVVSNENMAKSDSSEENFSIDNMKSGESMQSDSSIEITTKKPKKKKQKKGFTDKYMYMQGNNLYNPSEFRKNMQHFRIGHGYNKQIMPAFRRGLRLSYFLPKRMHWDEEQYQNLGYFWFNGPKGKYYNWKNK